MAVKTPEDRALADVERAIQAHEKAVEKAEAAQAKADEAYQVQKRAERELKWRASHPDLPEDFDLGAFRKQLEQPFEEEPEPEAPDDEAPESGEERFEKVSSEIDEALDEDDPFGDD